MFQWVCLSFAKSCAMRVPTNGVCSEGLKTIVLPASSAGRMCPLGRCPGKLKGPENSAHAVRFVAGGAGDVAGKHARDFGSAFFEGFDGQSDFADHRIDFGVGFPSRFAGGLTDCLDEIVAILFDELAEGFEESGSLGDGKIRPCFKCDGRADVTARSTSKPVAPRPDQVTDPSAGLIAENSCPSPGIHWSPIR